MTDLKTRPDTDLGAATKILITGSSAGGVGLFANCAWFMEELSPIPVKCAPQAGAGSSISQDYGNHVAGTTGNDAADSWPNIFTSWKPYAMPACKTAMGATQAERKAAVREGKCTFGVHVYQHYSTVQKANTFIVQCQYDNSELQKLGYPGSPARNQQQQANRDAYMELYGANTRTSLGSATISLCRRVISTLKE